MALPLPILPVPRQRYWQITADGIVPVAGSMSFFEAGTSTPVAVYADPDGNVSLGTIVNMDADGYLPTVYLPATTGVKVVVTDAVDGGGAQIFSQDDIEDVGATWLATWGQTMAEGSKSVTTGYEITDTDNLVTVDEPSTDPAIILLQPAADRGLPITIKNMGITSVAITPDGAETIDGVVGAFTVPPAASPLFPTVTLLSDGGSAYWIQSSHGLDGV